jgi:hypothetical protein
LDAVGRTAQAARLRDIRIAQGVLLLLGIGAIGLSAFNFHRADRSAARQLSAELQKRTGRSVGWSKELHEAQKEAADFHRLGALVTGAIGIIFVVFGCFIRQGPFVLTTIALIIYLLDSAALGFLDPATLWKGIIVRAGFSIALARAIVSAAAYERGLESADDQSVPTR